VKIPFVKAHGARNDFLLTWREQLPTGLADFARAALAICDRHSGIGADGWNILAPAEPPAHASVELWNSDGSRGEISGNGTRCAAALLVQTGYARQDVRLATGAGVRRLRLLSRAGNAFRFEMDMGRPVVEEVCGTLVPGRECVILNVGNPQCAVLVPDFDFDWRALGAALSVHSRFPQRANVSFVRVVDRHTLDVRFFERGAGATTSSGTGATGAVAAALSRGLVDGPVRVLTPAGPLELRHQQDRLLLAGPAEIVGSGEFYYDTN
jgi:diaminopimelate epimerase